MLQRILENLFWVAIVATFTVFPFQINAQMPCNDPGFNSALQELSDEAEDTAVFNNGRLVQTSLTIKGEPAKTIRYEFDQNNRLKFLTDENDIRIELIYDQSGNLQSFKFPDGGEAILQWNSSTSCKTVEGVKLKSPNGIERQLAGNCEDEMEQAAWAAAMASAICGSQGPGAACYAAMANLGYRMYRAYRACR